MLKVEYLAFRKEEITNTYFIEQVSAAEFNKQIGQTKARKLQEYLKKLNNSLSKEDNAIIQILANDDSVILANKNTGNKICLYGYIQYRKNKTKSQEFIIPQCFDQVYDMTANIVVVNCSRLVIKTEGHVQLFGSGVFRSCGSQQIIPMRIKQAVDKALRNTGFIVDISNINQEDFSNVQYLPLQCDYSRQVIIGDLRLPKLSSYLFEGQCISFVDSQSGWQLRSKNFVGVVAAEGIFRDCSIQRQNMNIKTGTLDISKLIDFGEDLQYCQYIFGGLKCAGGIYAIKRIYWDVQKYSNNNFETGFNQSQCIARMPDLEYAEINLGDAQKAHVSIGVGTCKKLQTIKIKGYNGQFIETMKDVCQATGLKQLDLQEFKVTDQGDITSLIHGKHNVVELPGTTLIIQDNLGYNKKDLDKLVKRGIIKEYKILAKKGIETSEKENKRLKGSLGTYEMNQLASHGVKIFDHARQMVGTSKDRCMDIYKLQSADAVQYIYNGVKTFDYATVQQWVESNPDITMYVTIDNGEVCLVRYIDNQAYAGTKLVKIPSFISKIDATGPNIFASCSNLIVRFENPGVKIQAYPLQAGKPLNNYAVAKLNGAVAYDNIALEIQGQIKENDAQDAKIELVDQYISALKFMQNYGNPNEMPEIMNGSKIVTGLDNVIYYRIVLQKMKTRPGDKNKIIQKQVKVLDDNKLEVQYKLKKTKAEIYKQLIDRI